MINLNYLRDRILHSNIEDYFAYILKKHEENTENPSVEVYVTKIENNLKLKINAVLKFLHLKQ